MRTDKKLWEICEEIYTQLYQEANPSIEWTIIKQLAEQKKLQNNWYMDFYLPITRQQEIVETIQKKHHCNPYERKKINNEIYLGCSPNSIKNTK